jgi:hypothetical protein
MRGARGVPLIDLGAWVALVLGVDGGPASSDLCRPLEARPRALGLPPGGVLALRLHIMLSVPDDDITRLSAEVSMQGLAATGATPTPAFAALVDRSVASLIEPLRGLGGETTAPRVDVNLLCQLRGSDP